MNATTLLPRSVVVFASLAFTRTLAHARRLPVTAALVLSALGATAPVLGAPATVGFRGAARDGRFDGALPRVRPAAIWTFATDGPVRSSPLLVDGAIVFGSGDGNLYAVDATNGKERWRFATGAPVDGSPAYAAPRSGRPLIAVASRDGFLHAVDPMNGHERWKLALGADLPFHWGWDFLLSTPAVDGDRVFVGSGNGEVLAVDAASGKVLWRHATAGRVRSSPTVVDGVVYVGSFDGHLYALDAATGAERWKFATEGTKIDSEAAGFDRRSIQGSPAVSADQVVFGARDGMFYGVDRATGAQRWRMDHGMPWVIASPAIADGKAVVGSSDGRFVTAVDLAAGKELWRSRTGANQLSSPAVAGGVVVVGDFTGAVIGLDLANGRELWRFKTGDGVYASPLVVDGTIFIGSDDGKLYALRGDLTAPPATRAWRAVFDDPFVGFSSVPNPAELRDALVAHSYRHVGRVGLLDFLNARIADREPSVVVFASDNVPSSLVSESDGQPSLLRRYLDAGGKVVWLAFGPFALTFDPETNKFDFAKDYVEPARRILGVTIDDSAAGTYRTEATPLGREWGLPAGWWIDEEATPPQAGVEPLALNRLGHPVSWVKRFGGPPGTGFVQLWGNRFRMPDPRWVIAVAEHGLP